MSREKTAVTAPIEAAKLSVTNSDEATGRRSVLTPARVSKPGNSEKLWC